MEYIMPIDDTATLPSIGCVILGNNPKITKENISMLNLKDKSVMVKTSNGEIIFTVLDVNISISIWENLNIGINVAKSDDFSKIRAGDLLYKL
ncbi:hypothetical protein [Clostridium felsineum]|uniref:hypothetical protein n=1 Tax=Clostridium felsineum TaxID=36839 RepID=UPI00098C1B3E|nr:hypothetical protein [Clostridium felsineum]URZ16727.1 hypothetical protein CLFE_027740 [Clostridium felsineum DSM 794]